MRVVMVGPGFPPTAGGVETHMGQLGRGLVGHGVDIEVWALDPDAAGVVSQIAGGVLVRRFPATRSTRFSVSPALLAHARRHLGDADIVHAHSYHGTAALALLPAPAEVPVVFTPHYHGTGHTTLASALHQPYRAVGRRLFARADRVVSVSDAERTLLLDSFPDVARKTSVIPNAADVRAIHAATSWPDQPPTLLVLGRLEPYKRVDETIAAFGRSQATGQLVIVGDGPDRSRLQAVAASSPRASDIRLLGRLDDLDTRRWLRTCRAVVSRSAHEAFGLVALEAVAAGARAVLSDLPAHREVEAMLPAGSVEICETSADLPARLAASLQLANRGPSQVRSWADCTAEHLTLFQHLLAART